MPAAIRILWSAPRSRSTAFFRMMLERGDHQVVHEPFSYLAQFGYVDVAGTRVTSEPELIAGLRALAQDGPVFVKDTSDERYPGVLADRAFLAEDAVHAFLIRDPRETLPSYVRINPELRAANLGFGHLLELCDAVRAATDRAPLVLDAHELLTDTAPTVARFCSYAGIDFRPDALTWAPGARAEWGPSAAWHEEVSRSSGFSAVERPVDTSVFDDPHLAAMLADQAPHYAQLRAQVVSPAVA